MQGSQTLRLCRVFMNPTYYEGFVGGINAPILVMFLLIKAFPNYSQVNANPNKTTPNKARVLLSVKEYP
jgi:hypothetical protein